MLFKDIWIYFSSWQESEWLGFFNMKTLWKKVLSGIGKIPGSNRPLKIIVLISVICSKYRSVYLTEIIF